jgi:hypothetical protein
MNVELVIARLGPRLSPSPPHRRVRGHGQHDVAAASRGDAGLLSCSSPRGNSTGIESAASSFWPSCPSSAARALTVKLLGLSLNRALRLRLNHAR